MSWNSLSKKRYFWAGISDDFDSFIESLIAAEREEEVDLYRFKMCLANKNDLKYFNAKERKEILALFKQLINDTRRHTRFITRLIKLLIRYREEMTKGDLK